MSRGAGRILCAALGALAGSILSEQSLAREPGDFGQYQRGVTMGDPVAAAPPPGLYFENTTLLAPRISGNGQSAGFKVDAMVDIPVLIWSTGWSFLGASVMAYVAQPVFNLSAWNNTVSGPPYPSVFYPTVHNTWVNPVSLSWNLGSGWFASAGFAVFVPDGSRYDNTANPDHWTYEPHAAVSYLANGWNLTANFVYDFNTASAGHVGGFAGTPAATFGMGYRSGDQAFLDITATKKFGNWEIGPVAYLERQSTSDRPGGGASCAQMAAATGSQLTCGHATDFAIGGLVGYDFGRVALKLILTESVYTKDEFGGFAMWTKLSFPLFATTVRLLPLTKPA